MIQASVLFLEWVVAAAFFLVGYRLAGCRFEKAERVALIILSFCALCVSFSIAAAFSTSTRIVTLIALGEKNGQAENAQIYLREIRLDGEPQDIPTPVSGQWSWYQGLYCWFEDDDDRLQEGTTKNVSFALPIARETSFVFVKNKWKGQVRIQTDGTDVVVDTYAASEEGQSEEFHLPPLNSAQIRRAIGYPVFGFALVFSVLFVGSILLVAVGRKIVSGQFHRLSAWGGGRKILRYQFLFEELVSRDFKKKYKRTVLGMVWSILSPLLTLLVMRIVFTQFFGRGMEHYTIYLFCGNLVFSYFSESTGQGMTSLMDNAGIFTKVNVPKYLFLLSKNTQTLINFSLTLCVFFLFCIIDQVTFTWRFILLLYPVCLLVLFNIGMGLILSALFVFFRDVQYLWAVFTQLLMYLSAIFYTIDQYSYTVRCAFLLNPIYLFIRYFRKIVLEAAVPTAWFHLLMLADVVAVLLVGCWMYKKYNTRFLYYV